MNTDGAHGGSGKGISIPSPGLAEVQRIAERLRTVDDAQFLLQVVFAHAPYAAAVVGVQGELTLANRAFTELFGSEPPVGYNLFKDEQATQQGLVPLLHRAFAGETVQTPGFWFDPREVKHVDVKEGRRVGIQMTMVPLIDPQLAVRHVVLCYKDVTVELGLKESEDALRHSREELETTLNCIGDAVIATDPAGNIVRMNPMAEQLTGWTAGDAHGRPLEEVFRIFNEETRASVESPVRQALRDGLVVGLANHTVLVSRDGAERPIADSAAPIRDKDGSISGVIMVFRDKSEEAAQEKALRKREELFHGLLDAAPDATVVLGDRGLIRLINKQAVTLFGYSQDELVGKPIEVLIPEKFRGRHLDHVRRFDAEHQPRVMGRRMELKALRKDGTEVSVDVSLSPMAGPEGRLVSATIRDVTERERTEKSREVALRAAEEALAQVEGLLSSIPDFVMLLDAKGTIQAINRVLSHFTTEQVIGSLWLSYLPPEQHVALAAALDRVIATGEPQSVEASVQGPDGTTRWYSNSIGPVRSESGITGAVNISRDVTERKRTEAQLIVSDRMAAVGTLAAGVAHEINNPLAAVIANLSLAARDVAEHAARLGLSDEFRDLREGLQDASEAAERIRNIVRDLKLFSRAEEEKKGAVDVRRVMESTLRISWNEIRHRARLVKNYGETPMVVASDSRLGQVFLNLVVNAAQAIKEGSAEKNEIRISTSTDGSGRGVVEISDTGPGMSPEVLGRLFTPFFTTKPVGVGTGLGLSICHRIVTGFGGSIEVKSEVGKGTLFRVSLLPAPAELGEEEGPTIARTPTAQRRGRILVVDDEPMVAKAVRRSLSPEHEVVTVLGGEEALKRIGDGEVFDVILCDLMMPQMTGMELHAALLKVAADQARRMVFLTGGAFTTSSRAFLDEVANLRLEKPFDPLALRSVINDCIRASSPL